MGLFGRKRNAPNLQPMLIRKDELKDAFIEAQREINKVDISNMQFQAMIQEYSELRQELRTSFQHQNTMITLIASTLGVLVTVSLNIYISDKFTQQQYGLIALLFCAIIPGVIAFLGILWLDQIYRQVKLGTYVSIIEKKVNKVLNMDGKAENSAMYWEQWVYNQTKDKFFLAKVNHYQYYMCMGLFLVAPIISLLFGLLLINQNLPTVILSILKANFDVISISVIVGLVFYLLFWLFAGIYAYTVQKQTEFIGTPKSKKKAKK